MTTKADVEPSIEPGDFLTPAEVVEIFPGVTETGLAIRRHKHQDPPFLKVGRRIYYPVQALRQWIEAATVWGTDHVHQR